MAFSAGDFSASALHTKILEKFEEQWVDDHVNKHLKVPTPTFNELASTRSVSLPNTSNAAAYYTDPHDCRTLKMSWLSGPATRTPVAKGTGDDAHCSFTGPETGSDSVEYAKPGGKSLGFSVKENTCKEIYDFTDKVSHLMMENLFFLRTQAQKDLYSFIIANTDDLSSVAPSLPTGGLDAGGAADDEWKIGAAYADDVKSLIHINHVIEDQFMINPYHLTGQRFRYEADEFAATAGGGIADSRSLILNSRYPILRDVHYFDTLVGSSDWFAVDAASLAYVNYTHFMTDAPKDEMVSERISTWRMPDPILRYWNPVNNRVEAVMYDVRMRRTCSSNFNEYTTHFSMTLSGGWLKAPKDVTSKPQIIQVKFVDAA